MYAGLKGESHGRLGGEMESLLSAYASHSEDEEEEDDHQKQQQKQKEAGEEGGRKRLKHLQHSTCSASASAWCLHEPHIQQRQDPAPAAAAAELLGPESRYASKRERAALLLQQQLGSELIEHHPSAATISSQPASASDQPSGSQILDMSLPIHIQQRIDKTRDTMLARNYLPKGVIAHLRGHDKGVNCIRWSPTHGSLIASAGMDQATCIWKLWKEGMEQPACKIVCHTAAVKDVQWSLEGNCVLTCGFDKTSRLIDVETKCEKQVFEENQMVNAVQFHPFEADLFLSGGSKGALRLWDIRCGKITREYFKSLGQILDFDFSKDGKRFVSTSDIAERNASDKTIVMWDFYNQIPLSNQVYMEPYTCPSVHFHPYEDSFIAQSNAGYIAAFSAQAPYKLNKHKRFADHEVSGFRVKCNFSPDGEYVITGSADGCPYFYSYRSCKCLKRMKAHKNVCMDVAYHPLLSSVVASCSWDGSVFVFE